MGKSYKANDDNHSSRRNNVARGMIETNQGKKQVFRDKRDRRLKDYKRSWECDQEDEQE